MLPSETRRRNKSNGLNDGGGKSSRLELELEATATGFLWCVVVVVVVERDTISEVASA